MADKATGHRLYGIWKKKFAEANSDKPPALREYRGSKYRDAAMLKGIAEEIGEDVVLEIMDWYFLHRSRHDLSDLVFNYDSFLDEMEAREREALRLEKLRKQTRDRILEMGIEL
ncbi:MAG: hypothetical protein LC650_01045 [Actinobacteria bacterium]|nr:hypothetical protein [Actinomycetota bacterium]